MTLLDPCAGDGEAIATLRDLWYPNHQARPRWQSVAASTVACELEAERALQLAERLRDHRDEAHHADAFNLRVSRGPGATVCYLNPPYDTDADHGRLEQRFLARFTGHILPGYGYLMLLVPHYALSASADFLARNYLDIRAWRLPAEHFASFKQVLLVARRSAMPLHAPALAETIRTWAGDATALPELPWACPEPRAVAGTRGDDGPDHYGLAYDVQPIDTTAMLQRFEAWQRGDMGTDRTAHDLLGVILPTAVPPRPAHIAIALSAGMFNGKLLEPNDATRHPPILAKGVFERELTEVDEKRDASGELVATVAIERPTLVLTILRLDTCAFHTLASGTVASGSDDPAGWNTADLITHYDRSLAKVMAKQFPPLHDASDAGARLALPRLPRTPFTAQDDSIQAALKLIATGRNPQLLAEVGTGKTTMALVIAAALSPEHHTKTSERLAALGFPTGRLPCARRTLVVCPPHLIDSWQREAEAVVPNARVRVIEGPADLGHSADLYLLSREKAKLGHGYAGIAGRCPLSTVVKKG